ncbi:helix-turn-helix domain-containing protein [Adlercreutzia faecimuris]|uniref:Helix-turn-helix domain-containing protein n=1 Tax=Adlercreutzia faecimuris TaxID=2897341 RepID=A0ABS9WF47_9ACTN|nr:helix-turn-helix transcriptional regulator [Adlercreutzia sp. JBNU-10]MCI2241400.1 helix-turn-helix domain-containing protein [Adlercreutzia sp. JBNU-10]
MDAKEKRAALGIAVRRRREEQGLSQQRLALMMGSSKSHIWRIETGRVSVGIDDLIRIADALDARVGDFIAF